MTDEARAAAILERLREIRAEADAVSDKATALMDERIRLYQEGQALSPRLTQAQMGDASGVTDAAVTLALRSARERAAAAEAEAHRVAVLEVPNG